MNDTNVPTTFCPCCNAPLDSVTAANGGDGKPKPGNIAICIICTTVLVFTDTLHARPMNPDDVLKMEPKNRATLLSLIMALKVTHAKFPDQFKEMRENTNRLKIKNYERK